MAGYFKLESAGSRRPDSGNDCLGQKAERAAAGDIGGVSAGSFAVGRCRAFAGLETSRTEMVFRQMAGILALISRTSDLMRS